MTRTAPISRTAALSAKDRYESRLISLYGPKPENIFKRLRESIDLSHSELAAKMFTTKQSLIRLEQGLFEAPLPAAVEWWVNNHVNITEAALTDQYEEYQILVRKRHHQFFGPTIISESKQLQIGQPHPLAWLRTLAYGASLPKHAPPASVTEIAKALCVNQATLQYWEKRWKNQKSVPKSFNAALTSIGYRYSEMVDFNAYYHDWRLVQLGRLEYVGSH